MEEAAAALADDAYNSDWSSDYVNQSFNHNSRRRSNESIDRDSLHLKKTLLLSPESCNGGRYKPYEWINRYDCF